MTTLKTWQLFSSVECRVAILMVVLITNMELFSKDTILSLADRTKTCVREEPLKSLCDAQIKRESESHFKTFNSNKKTFIRHYIISIRKSFDFSIPETWVSYVLYSSWVTFADVMVSYGKAPSTLINLTINARAWNANINFCCEL